jgi:hypothetical protein
MPRPIPQPLEKPLCTCSLASGIAAHSGLEPSTGCTEAMSRRESRHAWRRSSHSSEPMMRIPPFNGTGLLLVNVSSFSSHGNQFRNNR